MHNYADDNLLSEEEKNELRKRFIKRAVLFKRYENEKTVDSLLSDELTSTETYNCSPQKNNEIEKFLRAARDNTALDKPNGHYDLPHKNTGDIDDRE